MTSQESDESQITSEKPEEIKSKLFTCDICGKTFTSENSLKAHKLRIHKQRVIWKKKEEGRGIEKEEAAIPNAESHLKSFLTTFGVSKRDSEAVVQYLKPYGYDNLEKLNEGLIDLGIGPSRRKIIIEAWSNIRGIPIPPNLARRYGIKNVPVDYEYYGSYVYDYGYGYPPYQPRHSRSEIGELLNGISNLLQSFNKPPPVEANSGNQQIIANLQQEISELRSQLEEERAKRQEERLQRIENTLNELKTNQNRVANQFSAVETAIRELGDIVKTYLNLGKIVLEKKPEKPPVREKVGGESIIYDLLPNELIIEEKEEE